MEKYKNFEYETRKVKKRPWGNEIQLFVIDEDKQEYNIVMSFENVPGETAITDMAIFWMEKILSEEDVIEDVMVSENEVLKMLKEKNIIEESVKKLEDIKKKTIEIGRL